MPDQSEEIVIVGAGPTGLALAAELWRLGRRPRVFDRLAEGVNTSRAAVIHARTLEVLEPLGAVDALLSQGIRVPEFRAREHDRVLATLSFSVLQTAYPFGLLCPQDRTEAILLDRLHAFGGEVERPREVVALTQDTSGVDVTWKVDGRQETLRTQWVVGCDGMRSLTREQAGIGFEGGSYDENFVLGDLRMEWPIGRDEVSLFFSPQGLVLVAPLPPDRFRVIATVAEAPAEPSLEDFERILRERGPRKGQIQVRHVVWSSRFHIHHRIARKLRAGRLLIAGDAAHVHSPAGGQGMNTGIQDAVGLAAALDQHLRTGDEAVLADWEAKRLKIARSVVSMTNRMTRFGTSTFPGMRLMRNLVLGLVSHVPAAQAAVVRKLSELDNR